MPDITGASHPFSSAGGTVIPNVFQHVALTYDRATGVGILYVNGEIVAHSNMGSFVPQTSYDFWIGHRPGDVPGEWTYGAYLHGLLDELSIYNRALSQREIRAIYDAGSAGKSRRSIPAESDNRNLAVGRSDSHSMIRDTF